jgi:hypothetical protein
MEVPLLGQGRSVPAPEPEAALIEAETAFIVYRYPDGKVGLTYWDDDELTIDRQAHPHDIIGMSEAVNPETDEFGGPEDGRVSTAFLVYRGAEGEVLANTDIDVPIVAERTPHSHDVRGMLAAVVRDVDTISHAPYFAQAVVQAQMMAGRAMQQQMQNQQIQAKLAGGK